MTGHLSLQDSNRFMTSVVLRKLAGDSLRQKNFVGIRNQYHFKAAVFTPVFFRIFRPHDK